MNFYSTNLNNSNHAIYFYVLQNLTHLRKIFLKVYAIIIVTSPGIIFGDIQYA